MAENLSIKKCHTDCVLECPLCLHQLRLPQTLQQCLHSYCKSCLDKVPQIKQDGRQGWLCPMCENFTRCDQIQQNTFIEELQKIHNEPKNCDKVKCEQCLEDCGLATWKCAECKIGLCEIGKALHFKIPMLKGHNILPMDEDGENVIDHIVFCKVHKDIPVQLNCIDCEKLICYKCTTSYHQDHRPETVEEALERILPETESSAAQVDENISIVEAQIKGVKKEIEQVKESYASCRMKMDEHLEKVICRMRAMKAQMEEDVNEQESIALDTLKQLKHQLEKQLSQANIISNLTAVVINKSRHTSQLQQLQNGLFEKNKSASWLKNMQRLSFNLPVTDFIEGERFQEESDNVFGNLCFSMKDYIICIPGESYPNQFLCSDLKKLAKAQFKKDKEMFVDAYCCTRLSYMENKIWLPLGDRNKINIYDEEGELEQVIDTVDKSMFVVKAAYNGDIICLEESGLFVTDIQFSKWTLLSEGKFSDVVIDKDQFIALQYDNPSVHTYHSVVVNNGQECSWLKSHSFMLTEDVNIEADSSICIVDEQYLLVSSYSLGAKGLYKLTCRGEHLDSCKDLPFYPVICGTDKNKHVLVADFTYGNMYLFKPLSEKEIQRTPIMCAVPQTRSVVVDQNSNLWVLVGDSDDDFKLIKFAPQQ